MINIENDVLIFLVIGKQRFIECRRGEISYNKVEKQ